MSSGNKHVHPHRCMCFLLAGLDHSIVPEKNEHQRGLEASIIFWKCWENCLLKGFSLVPSAPRLEKAPKYSPHFETPLLDTKRNQCQRDPAICEYIIPIEPQGQPYWALRAALLSHMWTKLSRWKSRRPWKLDRLMSNRARPKIIWPVMWHVAQFGMPYWTYL